MPILAIMRIPGLLLLLAVVPATFYWSDQLRAGFPPEPRPLPLLDDECHKFAAVDFARLLTKLKTERDALEGFRKSLSKQRLASKPTNEQEQRELEELLKLTLDRLRQEDRTGPTPQPLPELEVIPQKPELKESKPKDTGSAPKDAALPDAAIPGGVDPLSLGNALFRVEKFEPALASFRLIDLKAKKPEERAPIQFLMASCLLRLGKNDEAVEILREVANSRSDERMSGYAQWQLEMHRWQRDINDRLQDIRRRRLATEKQP